MFVLMIIEEDGTGVHECKDAHQLVEALKEEFTQGSLDADVCTKLGTFAIHSSVGDWMRSSVQSSKSSAFLMNVKEETK